MKKKTTQERILFAEGQVILLESLLNEKVLFFDGFWEAITGGRPKVIKALKQQN